MFEKQSLKQEQLAQAKEQMSQTTEALGQKIIEFEVQLHETKRAAEEAMDKVKTAAQSLSPSYQIRLHPLPAVGAASIVGFLLARWLGGPVPKVSLRTKFAYRFSDEIGMVKAMIIGAAVKAVARKVIAASPRIANELAEVERSIIARVNRHSQPESPRP